MIFLDTSNAHSGAFYFGIQNEISFRLFLQRPHFCEAPLYFLGSLDNWLAGPVESTAGYNLVLLKIARENAKKCKKIGKIAENCNFYTHYLINKMIPGHQFDFSGYLGCYSTGL